MNFKLPDIGEGTAEGEIIRWLVAEGDVVAEDDPLVEVMTDKATVEIPSPRAGRIAKLNAAEGEIVAVGSVILVFDNGDAPSTGAGEVAPPVAAEKPAPASESPDEQAVQEAKARARAELTGAGEKLSARPWEVPPPGDTDALASPATRRLARELGVDLSAVPGSGTHGRITKQDVQAFADSDAADPVPAWSPEVGDSRHHVIPPRAEPSGEREERIPFRGLRRRIAERMTAAMRTVPHYTYVEEADMTEIVQLRRQAKAIGAEHGIRVTYLPFIIRAVIEALRLHPVVNSSLDEEAGELVIKRTYNIGIATATERGLIVPVIHDAERLGIFDLAREIQRLAADARDGKSALEDLQGGTFTITSTGNIGGVLATPIINQPEVAILGVTAIRQRAVVRDDEIVARHMLNLSLSLDHRVVDGADGALFTRDLVRYLEDPKLQLLGSP